MVWIFIWRTKVRICIWKNEYFYFINFTFCTNIIGQTQNFITDAISRNLVNHGFIIESLFWYFANDNGCIIYLLHSHYCRKKRITKKRLILVMGYGRWISIIKRNQKERKILPFFFFLVLKLTQLYYELVFCRCLAIFPVFSHSWTFW